MIGLLERIIERKYQICLVDPEGDYENLPGFRTLGSEKHAPSLEEIAQALDESEVNVIINLVGVAAADRAHRFSSLITSIQGIRLRTGRPHWIIIDEAHHVWPSEWALAPAESTGKFTNILLITVHPEHVSPQVLANINIVVTVGASLEHRCTNLPEQSEKPLRFFRPPIWNAGRRLCGSSMKVASTLRSK